MTNESETETTPRSRARSGGDAGEAEVQQRVDEENAKGYSGTVPDPTPNENYTLRGNDLPTPETDDDLAAEAREKARRVGPR